MWSKKHLTVNTKMEKLNYTLVKMTTENKWWDKWFVVGNLTIDVLLKEYNYWSMSAVYLLNVGCWEKGQFVVKKPRRNLKGDWSRLDIIGFIDSLGGVLTEVEKLCGNDIYCLTDERIVGRDEIQRQKILVFFATDTREKSEHIEQFLNDKKMVFLMADDVPFSPIQCKF